MAVDAQALLEQLRQEEQAASAVTSQPDQAATEQVDPKEMLEMLKQEEQISSEVDSALVEHGIEQDESFSDMMGKAMFGKYGVFRAPTQLAIFANDINNNRRGLAISAAKGFVEAGQGPKQLSLETAERMNILPKGTALAYTRKTDQERKTFTEAFNKEFGDSVKFKVAEVGGALLPYLLIGSRIPAGATLKQATAIGGGVGFGTGLGEYKEEGSSDTRLASGARGAAMAALPAAALNVLPAMRNRVRDFIGAGYVKTPQAKKAMELGEKTGTYFKPSQVSDDPVLQNVENIILSTVKGQRAAKELARTQIKQNLSYFNRVKNSILEGKSGFGKKLEDAFTKTLKDLDSARKSQGNVDFTAAYKAANGERNIDLSKTIKAMRQLIKEGDEFAGSAEQRLAKQLTKKLEAFEDGKVNAVQMQKLLRTYGRGAKGKGGVFDEVNQSVETSHAKYIFKSLNDDLEAAIKAGKPGSQQLKLARDNYRANSEAIKSLEDSALKTLFGGKVKTADEIESAFMNMKSSQVRDVMGLLSKSDPTLQKRLQSFWLEQHLSKATTQRSFDVPSFDPAKMLDMVSGKNMGKFKAVFNDHESRRLVIDGLRAAQRVIARNDLSVGSGGGGAFIQKIAGVLASGDKTFVARLAAEILTPKAMSRLMTKDGVRLLQQYSRTKNANAAASALVQMNNMLGEDKVKENKPDNQ